MKRIIFALLFASGLIFSVPSKAQTETKERMDYLIVVSNSKDETASQKVFDQVKGNYQDAGIIYDLDTDQYIVYIERYYDKAGADYAVWWHKKEKKGLPKIYAKAVPAGTK